MGLYKAFGMTIESPIELPELMPAEFGNADVIINLASVDTFGILPREVELLLRGNWWQAAPVAGRIMFGCYAGIYDIKDGSEITVDMEPGVPPEAVRMFLLGSALGAVQVQRGRVPIHGGAVVSQAGAVIITGGQGAGKSTMTSALVHNGFKYLTDDVSSVELRGGAPAMVHAAYPQRKLVRDASIRLGFDPETLPVIDAGRDKFAIRDRDSWQGEGAEIGMIVELVPVGEGERLHSERVDGHARLELTICSLYRAWMHRQGGNLPPEEFKKILTVAAQLDARRVYVPRGIDKIIQYAHELEHELGIYPQ